MKTLNLTRSRGSDVKYKLSEFPDGQQNISIPARVPRRNGITDSNVDSVVKIKSRLNNWLDLQEIRDRLRV